MFKQSRSIKCLKMNNQTPYATLSKKITPHFFNIFILTIGLLGPLLVSFNAQAETEKNENKEVITKKTDVNIEEEPAADLQKATIANIELGLGYLAQGQVARAKTKLNHALKLGPNMPEAHSAMAYFFEKAGEYKEAESEHKKSLRLAKNKGAVYNNYGAFLCRQSRFKEADNAFKRAFEDKTYPRSAEVYENAGVCALRGGDEFAAENYLSTALKQDAKRGTAILELANIHLKKENYIQAKDLLTHYKQFSEPNSKSLWLGIQVADAMGDQDGVASMALLLKNSFENSPEFQAYLNSDIGRITTDE